MTKQTKNDTLLSQIEGKNKADAMDILVPAIGYKEAEVYWKENGAASKMRGFRALFYKELEARDFTKEEVKAFAETNGSPNDAKQYSHYVAIADLIKSVRASKK